MTRKWVFFDIDGTLVPFGDNESPSPETTRALAALRERGHRVILCTGRTRCDVGEALLRLGADGLISGAGARIELDGCCLREMPIPLGLLRRTAEQILRMRVSCLLEGTDQLYYVGQGSVQLPWDFPRITRADQIVEEMSVEKFTAHTSDRSEFSALEACLVPDYDIYARSDGCFFEMVRKGQNKGAAIRWLCAHCGVAAADTIAFGDSPNDISMLRFVGTGVAMGGSPAEVCREAAFVTGTLEQEGVAAGLSRLGLI